ncbi:ETS domain-containing protein Elk-1-like isoform X2 [Orbicella faveolata]|uniref:ETS domain-containing protein Elk-1-like isoform X2 n=1 Tax=Orbicella faveolata TaxID=48498 RepID=UPI0009E55184|nr:ETS domain-containing protein Elk-1-like isoform X2 [Orbicella faveolata]
MTTAEMEINKSNNARGKPRYKNIIHLWEFLLELLANENFCAIISWSRREQNEFKLKKPKEVARRWGILRRKKGMTYEKLSRSLRFYYGQGIIQKVPGQTFTYRFDKLPYKYEPGITRSLRHEHKMAASLHEQEEITPDQTTTQIKPSSPSVSEQTSFLPTCSPGEDSWSLVPKPALPVRMCPQLTSQLVNLSSITLPTSVQPAPVKPVLKTGLHESSAKSIPVSVIKRVQTDPNDICFNATITNSSVCIAVEPPPNITLYNTHNIDN